MRSEVEPSSTGATLRLPMVRLPTPTSLSRARHPLLWRTLLLRACVTWLATRLGYAALTLFYPLVTGDVGSANAISTTPISLTALIRRWVLWDGGWYIRIAQHGYTTPTMTVFFPLYPAFIRSFAMLIGPHWAAAALLTSNLAALLAFIGIALLAAQVAPDGKETAVVQIALSLFAAYPLAFFLVAAYSDGLFAGLVALTLLFGMRRRWGWAALMGVLAALCRPTGPALVLPLAWEAFQRYRELRSTSSPHKTLREMAGALAAVVAPLAGVGIYSLGLWLRFGDPLAFVHAESAWAHFSLSPALSIPLALLAFAHIPTGSPLQLRVLLDLAPTLVAIILTAVAARRAPLAFTLYLVALLLMLTSEPLNYLDLFVSGGRYLLAAVPLYVILAGWLTRSEWLLPVFVWSGVLLQAMLALFFLRHGWLV